MFSSWCIPLTGVFVKLSPNGSVGGVSLSIWCRPRCSELSSCSRSTSSATAPPEEPREPGAPAADVLAAPLSLPPALRPVERRDRPDTLPSVLVCAYNKVSLKTCIEKKIQFASWQRPLLCISPISICLTFWVLSKSSCINTNTID